MFRNRVRFYGEKLLAPHPKPKLEDHPLSAFREWLFNTFAATLHIGGRFSIHNLRTHHVMVTDPLITGQRQTTALNYEISTISETKSRMTPQKQSTVNGTRTGPLA